MMAENEDLFDGQAEAAGAEAQPQTALAKPLNPEIMARVIEEDDLSGLSVEQRNEYYLFRCAQEGFNPATRPFAYIWVKQGRGAEARKKLILYATKNGTEQARRRDGISVTGLKHDIIPGQVCTVTVQIQNGKGRLDMATGSVSVKGLSGDWLANAVMKAETKAKRRATLSLCSLGMPDESELETMPVLAANGNGEPERLPAKSALAEMLGDKSAGAGSPQGPPAANPAEEAKQAFMVEMQKLSERDIKNWELSRQDCGNLYREGCQLAGADDFKAVAKWIADNATLGLVEAGGGEIQGVRLQVNQAQEA